MTRSEATEFVDVVFDGPPGPEAGRFVEVESPPGIGVSFGEWVKRDDGFWALRFPLPPDAPASAEAADEKWRKGVLALFAAVLAEDYDAFVVRAEAHIGTPGQLLAWVAEQTKARGAEAMREAAAKVAESFRGPSPNPDDRPGTWLLRQAENIAAKIRALPTPAATCETCKGDGMFCPDCGAPPRGKKTPPATCPYCGKTFLLTPDRFRADLGPDCATVTERPAGSGSPPENKPDTVEARERQIDAAVKRLDTLGSEWTWTQSEKRLVAGAVLDAVRDTPRGFEEPDKAGEAERRFLEAARETDRLRRQYPGRPLNDPERPKLRQRIDQAKRKERQLRHEWSIALQAAEKCEPKAAEAERAWIIAERVRRDFKMSDDYNKPGPFGGKAAYGVLCKVAADRYDALLAAEGKSDA